MYAIKNTKTGKWVYGTDYREYPNIQRESNNKAMLFETFEDAGMEFGFRQMTKEYEIIKVELIQVGD